MIPTYRTQPKPGDVYRNGRDLEFTVLGVSASHVRVRWAPDVGWKTLMPRADWNAMWSVSFHKVAGSRKKAEGRVIDV